MARDRSNEWIGSMFVGLGLGAAGIAGALAWVTSVIGAASIPIWISAVGGGVLLFRGSMGNALAHRISGKGEESDALGTEVYGELDELRARVAELEERVDFSERVLTKRDAAPALPPHVR